LLTAIVNVIPQGPAQMIFTEQISVRQNRHCRNLDTELIDFVKRYEKLRHLS
jgi:hypothetical protein